MGYWWQIRESSKEKFTQFNPRTDYFVTLGTDYIKEYYDRPWGRV